MSMDEQEQDEQRQDEQERDEYEQMAVFLQEYVDEHHEFLSWLGLTVDSAGPGTMTMSIPYDEKLTNQRQEVTTDADHDGRLDIHGGVAATLIDTVGGIGLRTTFDDPASTGTATINLNVNYLRPAVGDLRATANVVRSGSTVGVSEVLVESPTPEGELKAVATGQASYRIFRGK